MEADLSQPPPPRSSASSPSNDDGSIPRRNAANRPTRKEAMSGQLDKTKDKWSEWSERATDMSCDWVVDDDMKVLAEALSDEPTDGLGGEPTEKIRAVSDFAPIKERVRRGPKRRRDILLIFTIIFLEFLTYLLVRQMVNIIEFFSSWHGQRGRLRLALRNSKTYEEWKQRALALDDYLHLSEWKKSAPNAYYDAPLVRRVLRTLRELREKEDAEGVCAVLHAVLRSNFAGTESFRLYSESYYGTKELVQEFVDEVTRSIGYIRTVPPSLLPLEDKADFFRSVAKNLGASALCLSGGASFGYYHFGVIRALLDQNLLPRVVTGTSAGAIVAAFACCRTDSEIAQLLTPALADRITACSDPFSVWIQRAWRTGARFDTVEWARRASFFTMGNMTFREAWERTGRVLNVSVIPYDTHSPTKLLNYLTAPDCVIYTAVIASAAVPGILNPVVLLTKDKNGKLHPWEFQGRHKDGSLRVDIPLHSLHLLYNVNFSLVSQVNPHIHLFNFAPRGAPGRPVAHRSGKGWRGGFLLSAAEQYLKIELMKNFRVIRDLELLPEFGGQNWSAVFLQKFEGSVTIWPKSRLKDWFRILTDPDRDELARMIRVGQGVTWPKIKMIENRLKIERQIDLGREDVRRALEGLQPPALVHRTSSDPHFPSSAAGSRSRTSGTPTQDSGEPDPEERGVTFDSAAAEQGQREGEHATPAKRRQAILARLGLKGVAGAGPGGVTVTADRGARARAAGPERGERRRGGPIRTVGNRPRTVGGRARMAQVRG
ncbi:SPOSA6832_01727 [Sporobolomyces salmonicolor]|uniref:Patatin-like phospholipase domain-containing protein n=1 Tax=Sporidiobolus salmonicolor TaxID=5005 RepID=A0A0D6EJI1_SPOSA|nr:SPOSA6832_01727 [Sporobolomyces salmonicolor]